MSLNEVNELLEDKWFVIDADGVIHIRRDEDIARALCVTWDAQYPSSAPHHAVQLQVKGTLPEGAIMPKYKVGDRIFYKSGTGIITGINVRYEIDKVFGSVQESLLAPADPMRDEFEAWCKKEKHDIERRGEAYTRIDTAYAWIGWQAAKAGAK